jgi:hypothetical protein
MCVIIMPVYALARIVVLVSKGFRRSCIPFRACVDPREGGSVVQRRVFTTAIAQVQRAQYTVSQHVRVAEPCSLVVSRCRGVGGEALDLVGKGLARL